MKRGLTGHYEVTSTLERRSALLFLSPFRQPYCKISFLVDAGLAERKTASRYLQELERLGILRGEKVGREIIYRHEALLEVLSQ